MLKQYIEPYHTISIVGTVKNAGKTTVLNQLIDEYKDQLIAVTSIGLDGEKIDNITNLPKPQIHIYKNTIIATAYDCINNDFIIYEKTGISTPLGEIVIGEVTKNQDMLIAGPSTKKEMTRLVQNLKKYNVKKIFIDGALFRKSFASRTVCDALILSTGAAYHSDLLKVVKDTSTIVHQFKIEEIIVEIKELIENQNISYLIDENHQVTDITYGFLQTKSKELIDLINDETRYLYLRGALSDNLVQSFIEMRHKIKNLNIIVKDSTHILCSAELFQKLMQTNITINVLHKSNLLAVCYNPTSPYNYQFDNLQLKKELEQAINIPCINVVEDRK